jgi:hypothetical protein
MLKKSTTILNAKLKTNTCQNNYALRMTNNTVNLHRVKYKNVGTWLANIPP